MSFLSLGPRRLDPGVVVALGAMGLTTVVCTVAYAGLTIDDAFIAFRFAHHARTAAGSSGIRAGPPSRE